MNETRLSEVLAVSMTMMMVDTTRMMVFTMITMSVMMTMPTMMMMVCMMMVWYIGDVCREHSILALAALIQDCREFCNHGCVDTSSVWRVASLRCCQLAHAPHYAAIAKRREADSPSLVGLLEPLETATLHEPLKSRRP